MKNKIIKNLSKPWYALFGVTVLLIAVAGSAYAYYQASATSNAISGEAAGPGSLQLTVTDLSTSATGNLIPMDTDLTILNQAALGYGNSSGNQDPTKQCIDKNGYTVCKVYQINLKNNGTSPLIVTGGVTELSGTNTPNLTCTLMSDNHTVTTITDCVGNNTLANKVMINAGVTNTYFVMVYINNLGTSQTDSGTFNGTVEFNTGSGGVKASFYPTAEEKITNLFTKTGTVTEDPSGDAIVLDVDTTHSLIKDPNGNIRYYGASPNNYIKFNCQTYPSTNCEIWRIIGVVDGKVKLMRNENIGTFSWDTSANTTAGNTGYGINQWGESTYTTDGSVYKGADLMKLLNPGYETNQDVNASDETITVNNSLYYNSGSGTCYSGRTYAIKACDFTSTGVQGIKNAATRNKIAVTTYYLGGHNAHKIYPNVILDKESGTTVGSNSNDKVVRTTTWLGRVAVPYPSDYGYAADLSLCTGKNLYQYSDGTCVSNNWMKNIITNNGGNVGWLLTPYSGSAGTAWYVDSSGYVNRNAYTYNARGVVPVLYLSSDALIESGSGTEGDPYTLAA